MKISIKIGLFLFILPLLHQAQDAPISKLNTPFVVEAHIGIPKTISSSQFNQSFNGFYEADVSVNYRMAGNFYVGLGYLNTNLQNNKFLKQYTYANGSISYNTHLIGNSPFIKLSYDKFFKENAYVNFSLNYGIMFAHYQNVNEDTSAYNKPYGAQTFNAQFLQPEMSFNFIIPGEGGSADGRLAFSLIFGYNTLFYKYDPKAPRFNHFQEVRSKSNDYFMSWFSFGFGINVLIGKNK